MRSQLGFVRITDRPTLSSGNLTKVSYRRIIGNLGLGRMAVQPTQDYPGGWSDQMNIPFAILGSAARVRTGSLVGQDVGPGPGLPISEAGSIVPGAS